MGIYRVKVKGKGRDVAMARTTTMAWPLAKVKGQGMG